MAVQRAPVETWQMILRYAIAVPVFFDVEPIGMSGLDDSTRLYGSKHEYWKSERRRNNLRRVCSGWNSYLQQFAYRFVDLDDIIRGSIPLSALSRAIRLEYDMYKNILTPSYRKTIREVISEHAGPWPMEILQADIKDLTEIICEGGRVPHLRSVISALGRTLHIIAASAPNLRFLKITLYSTAQSYEFSHLTSLSVSVESIAPLLLCRLPSLRNLSIDPRSHALTPSEITDILRPFGKNLVTFFDNSYPCDTLLPDDIWSLCPKLERFQTGLAWPRNPQIPPTLHTIRIIVVFMSDSLRRSLPPPEVMLKDSIQRIAFTKTWSDWFHIFDSCMNYILEAMDYGVSVCDAAGTRFQDFLVAILSHRKVDIRSNPLECYRQAEPFFF